MINLYWPVYCNLEREVLRLTECVHFTDGQIDVYSVKIADLLVRCSIEIEALAKDLYRKNRPAQEPENCGQALQTLNTLWKLEDKLVVLSSSCAYFEDEAYRAFAPLFYKKGDVNDFYTAYNAVKHDRVKNLHKATIRVLLRALAALYLLNLYNKDEKIHSARAYMGDKSANIGSELFSVLAGAANYPGVAVAIAGVKDEERSKYTYIYQYPDHIAKLFHEEGKEVLRKQIDMISQDENIAQFIKENPNTDLSHMNLLVLAQKVGGEKLGYRFAQLAANLVHRIGNTPLEGVLNKNQVVYPFLP